MITEVSLQQEAKQIAEQNLTVDQAVGRQSFDVKKRIPLSLPNKDAEAPFASMIGAFKDDPMLDAMMANIRERRREIDNDDTIE